MARIHHIGYVVDDLRAGVERFAAATGAGPFQAMEHIPLDTATFRGQAASYDHSSAFAPWGPLLVELTEVHDAQPAGLREALTAAGAGLGHVAWLADDLDAEVARLQSHGLEVFHTGAGGPVRAAWLGGGNLFGHPVEILQRGPEVEGFYASVRAAAEGWDGRDPYRIPANRPS